jgi:hypothetical protein
MTARATAFVWNAGAWLGSLIGCTLWLALLGFDTVRHDLASGVALWIAFGLIWLDAVCVWRKRATHDPLRGFQRMCSVAFLASAAGLAFAFSRAALPDYPAITFGLCLLIYPALIGLFEFRQRAAQHESSTRP